MIYVSNLALLEYRINYQILTSTSHLKISAKRFLVDVWPSELAD